MANQATVTAPIGPAFAATALVLPLVTEIHFDLKQGVLSVFHSDNKHSEFGLSGGNTFTLTAVAKAYTLTVT